MVLNWPSIKSDHLSDQRRCLINWKEEWQNLSVSILDWRKCCIFILSEWRAYWFWLCSLGQRFRKSSCHFRQLLTQQWNIGKLESTCQDGIGKSKCLRCLALLWSIGWCCEGKLLEKDYKTNWRLWEGVRKKWWHFLLQSASQTRSTGETVPQSRVNFTIKQLNRGSHGDVSITAQMGWDHKNCREERAPRCGRVERALFQLADWDWAVRKSRVNQRERRRLSECN